MIDNRPYNNYHASLLNQIFIITHIKRREMFASRYITDNHINYNMPKHIDYILI